MKGEDRECYVYIKTPVLYTENKIIFNYKNDEFGSARLGWLMMA
jgi:hypothetical protein